MLVGTLLELTASIAEVPTGIIADVYSRRLSIIIGFVLVGIGFIVEGSIPQFWAILLAQVIWGIGITCQSGALEAWVADEVGEQNAGKAFLRGNQFGNAGALVGIGIAVWLGRLALNLPIVLGGVLLIVLALVLAFIMPETGFKPAPARIEHRFNTWGIPCAKASRSCVHGAVSHNPSYSRRVLCARSAKALTGCGSPDCLNFRCRISADCLGRHYQRRLARAGNPCATEFVNRRVDTNNQVIVARALQIIVALLMALMVVFGLAWNFGVALIAVLALKPIRGMNYPLATAWMNQHVESSVRATVFSIRNQGDALGQIIGGPIIDAIATLVSLPAEMVVAALFLIPALYVYLAKWTLVKSRIVHWKRKHK